MSAALDTFSFSRTVRIGRVVWRACLAAPRQLSSEPIFGKEYVAVTGSDERSYALIMNVGDFRRLSRYRLRCAILGLTGRSISTDE